MSNKLSKEQLVELVTRIMKAEGTVDQQDLLLDQLEANILDPNVSDYIYWPDKEMTPEEIVEKALSYKPIEL